MSVKHAVLGLLVQRRGYGYDLARRFDEQVGSGWQLNAGAIYTALDQLEKEGLIRRAVDEQGLPIVKRQTVRGAPRVMYEATTNGAERFERWMSAPTSSSPLREELHLKIALSQPHNLPQLIELTYEQEQACLERLQQYAGKLPFEQLLGSAEPWQAISAVMVRDAEVAYLSATIEWLRRVREAMRWLREHPVHSGQRR
jgi:DNA-binding PadR family transcriptional regulator